MDVPTFRTNFPEFADETAYPTSTITFWSNIAEKMVRLCRWDDMWENGVQLFTAHHIVIAKANTNASAVGGLPGQVSGPAQSKTVGSASVSYDTNSSLETGAGHWNLTTYGKQFIHLARLFGAGAVQL
jgi:hypothetical protein